MSGPEHKPDDTLLDDFLAGQSDLSRAYAKTQVANAPASLDAAVFALAQQAPVTAEPRRWKRLRTPIALAATIVLGVSVMLNIQRDPEAYRAARAPVVMTEEKAVIAMAPAMPEPSPVSAAPAEVRAKRRAAAPQQEVLAPVAPQAMDSSAALGDEAPAPAVAAAAPAPPPAGIATAESYSVMSRPEQAETAAPARNAQAHKRLMPRAVMAEAAAGAVVIRESSEEWLGRIRALRDAGQDEDARKLWTEYRLAYPAAPVPADLQRYEPAQPAEKPFSGDPTPPQ